MRIAKNDIPVKINAPGAIARQQTDFGDVDVQPAETAQRSDRTYRTAGRNLNGRPRICKPLMKRGSVRCIKAQGVEIERQAREGMALEGKNPGLRGCKAYEGFPPEA